LFIIARKLWGKTNISIHFYEPRHGAGALSMPCLSVNPTFG